MSSDPRHNGGPPLEEDGLTLAQAQALPDVQRRPSYVQRHAALTRVLARQGSPLRPIVGLGQLGVFGRWVLLSCGHWREVRDYDIAPIQRRTRPKASRCGCCRLGYLPHPADKRNADARSAVK